MNEQVIKEAQELVEMFEDLDTGLYVEDLTFIVAIKCAIKTQKRVVSELYEVVKENFPLDVTYDLVHDRAEHNKEILNYLKTLV